VKFLIDEDVPAKVLKALTAIGHDAVRVPTSTPDAGVARLALNEHRTLITLDKDFTNRLLYPPSVHSIIVMRIHPPFANDLIAALSHFLDSIGQQEITGLTVIQRDGHLRISQ
jgi:predicted nuclease of predicted toxin-antitoxin system